MSSGNCIEHYQRKFAARRKKPYEQFENDPFHPGLIFEEVEKKRHLWSARITRGYRILGVRDDSEITWFWIGTHREYEKLIS